MSLIGKKPNPSTSSPGVAGCLRPEDKKSRNEYVVVEPSVAEAQTTDTADSIGSAIMQRVRPVLSKTKVRKDGLVRVRLWQKIAQTQATTPLLTASALQPGSATGYSEFAVLYDTARCLGLEFWTLATSGTPNSIDCFGVAFDPGVSGNLSSVVGACEQKYHFGPSRISSTVDAAVAVGVSNAVSPTGLHHWSGKTVKLFLSNSTSDVVGGNWFPSTNTNAVIGYLKPYLENAAGSGTLYHTTYVAYDMEFKYRG
jgi:hypothetical protein